MPAYFRPRTLEEALAIRAARAVTVLAGGTDVYPARTARAGWGDMRQDDILDISAIEALRGMEETEEHIRFGALTTWTELRRAALPPAFSGYMAAAREVGGAQIQNRGTLVGNLCTASPAGDGIPCLLTLDAAVELASMEGRRTVPIVEFITGYRQTACRADEIVTAIVIPKPASRARGGFVKLGARRYLVISMVMAAAVVKADGDGSIAGAAIAVGACGPLARRLPELEAALFGRMLFEAPDIIVPEHLASLAPIDDIRASGDYRRAAALDLVRDLLSGLAAAPERRAA
ncbi:MAG: FAD binding domain-containing protein [Rhizobiales bacterium]|nr:FAD binding domain-containing protein [Hyphomicrobiales bacterium]